MLDLGKIGYKIFMDDGQYRKSMQALLGESQKTASAVSGMFSKLAGMVGLGAMFWKSAVAAKALSRELANIKSIAGELDAGKLRTELMNLNAQLGDTAELANAVYYAYSAGVRGTEAELVRFTGQIAALAKTVGSGVTPVMDAVTTMMNAYGMKVQDAGKLTDWFYSIVKYGKTTGSELAGSLGQIASTAAGAGIKLEELGAAIATLTTTMPTAVAITALGASIRAIMNPTDEAQKMAAKFGIELGGAAIQAKGLQGVLNEIYQKTGGRSDLIGQLIPDARASKALTALSGTQNQTLNQVMQEFGANSGEAARKFSEVIAASDSAKWDAMLVVVKKLGTAIGDMTFQVLTLGGALNGVYEWIFQLNSGAIQTIAKIGALTAGMFGLSKVIKMLKSGGASFLGLAIQGGYKPREQIAAENFERRKTLIIQRHNAVRMALEQRRHYQELKNAAESAAAVATSEKDKLTAQTARQAADNARETYRQAAGAALNAGNAVRMHNIAVKTGTTQVGLLRGAWNGFTAAIAANPLGLILTAATAAISVVIYLLESARQKAEDMKRASEEAASLIMDTFQKNEERRDKGFSDLFRLDELSRMQNLTNGEMNEAQGIITKLQKEYGDFQASVDRTTGSVKLNASAIKGWIEQARKARIDDLRKVYDVKSENEVKARYRLYFALEKRQRFDLENEKSLQIMIDEKNGVYTDAQKNLARKYLDARRGKKQAVDELTGAMDNEEDDKFNRQRNERLKKLEADSRGFTQRWDEELLTDEDRKARSYQRDFDNYKKIIDARKLLDQKYANEQYQIDLQNAQRRLSMLKDQNAAEAKARNGLLKKQADAYADGVLSNAEKLDLKEAEISGMDALIAEWEKQMQQLPAGERRRSLEQKILEKRLARNRAAGELETMRDEQTYSAAEQARQLALQEKRYALGGNGPLSEENQIELKRLEIYQQTARIEELMERREQAKTDEQRRQLSLQLAQAQSKRQEMDYELTSMREKKAADEAEYQRNLKLLDLQAKNREDGKVTYQESRAELALKVEQQRARVAEQVRRLQNETSDVMKRKITLSLAEARNQLGALLVEQRNLQPQRQVLGSFSASVLARMSEPNTVDKQQLSELRKIEKNTKDNSIQYGD